jgi:hypothetical protein
MCNQAVGLIAGEFEARGISTVSIVLLREVAKRVRPPRSLWVPFPHGYPLGRPNDVALQTRVIERALHLLTAPGPPPLLEDL